MNQLLQRQPRRLTAFEDGLLDVGSEEGEFDQASRPARVVTVAMANKTARIAWAVMTRGETYRSSVTA